MADYYAILGVSRDASQDEIKTAFRTLSKTMHPDKGGDPEEFKKINEAYDCLKDSGKRGQYDQFGSYSISNIEAAIKVLQGGFVALMKGFSDEKSFYDKLNETLRTDKIDQKTTIDKHEAEIKELDKYIDRIKRENKRAGENIFNLIIKSEIQRYEGQIAMLNSRIEIIELAQKILEEYKADKPKQAKPLMSGEWFDEPPVTYSETNFASFKKEMDFMAKRGHL